MTYDNRKKALKNLMFVRRKHDGRIQASGCADGTSQENIRDKFTNSISRSHDDVCAIDAR